MGTMKERGMKADSQAFRTEWRVMPFTEMEEKKGRNRIGEMGRKCSVWGT